MSAIWVRIIASFTCSVTSATDDVILVHAIPSFIPMNKASHVRRVDNVEQLTQFRVLRGAGAMKTIENWNELIITCVHQHLPKDEFSDFPSYFVYLKDSDIVYPPDFTEVDEQKQGVWCLLHPCERERMERHLNGTDSPIYDLVHELRYNPHVGVDPEKSEAAAHFLEEKRQKK